MTVTHGVAIELATAFAQANGYHVVPNIDGVVWQNDARPVKLDTARLINGEWAVLLDRMLPPGVESMSPIDVCVVVSTESRGCRCYPLL